jgi:ATP-dependent DNA ligase I
MHETLLFKSCFQSNPC